MRAGQRLARDLETRRVLAREAERRVWAGEPAFEVARALDIAPSTLSRWAKLFGFRLGDVSPGHPAGRSAEAPAGAAGGAGSWTGTGRFLRGEPGWYHGGRKRTLDERVDADAEVLDDPLKFAEALEACEAAGDLAGLDALISLQARRTRRAKALDTARREAEAERASRAPPLTISFERKVELVAMAMAAAGGGPASASLDAAWKKVEGWAATDSLEPGPVETLEQLRERLYGASDRAQDEAWRD